MSGADWSWAGLTDKLGGIMQNPQQLQENPWFQAGMGLLSASADGNINPYQAALGGLQTGIQNRQQAEQARMLAEWFKKQKTSERAERDPRASGELPDGAGNPQAMGAPQGAPAPISPGLAGMQNMSLDQLIALQSLMGNRSF